MAELTIINHIEIDGETYVFEELSEERKKEIQRLLEDRAMEASGYEEV